MPAVGMLGVSSFTGCSGMGDAVKDAVRGFKAAGVAGVIVDLRGNGGGDDDLVPELLNSFTDTSYTYETVAVPSNGASPLARAQHCPSPSARALRARVH